jgi:glucan phosphoethanolaminetransferase (alkaline phosphatase superfamily)
MNTVKMVLSVVLLVSAALGSYILATDSALWSVAPTHAYGLGAFVVIDLALMIGQWRKPDAAIIIMVLLGLAQLGAMSGDVFFGASTLPANFTTNAAFSKYLLGDAAFVTLLGVQVVLIVVGIAAFMMWRKAPGATK